jgi:murein DD-endopeptidase MepM/ murein hydrolase activator NlpD
LNGLNKNTLVPGLLNVANEVSALTQYAIQTYPKRITALVTTLALGGAGGAFAIASLAPDAADLPVRSVAEAVQPFANPASSANSAANLMMPLAAAGSDAQPLIGMGDLIGPLTLYRSDVSRANDTADTLLKRMGISDASAAAFLRADPLVRKSLWSRAGRSLSAEAAADHSLLKLVARWMPTDDGNFSRLIVEKTPHGMMSRVETAPLVAATRLASGTITSSLFAATDAAGLPDSIGVQVAEIFAGDIDFHRALRKGDRFSITYEALEADGEPMRSGRVLSAEFVNNGKTYQAMWFAGQNAAKGAYYTLDGQSLRRAYLASPLEFSRVTSGFKMRLHPIHQTWKAHLGVDYAAPTGTPVRTIGDGVVEFAGVQSGYGNVVTVQHGKENATVYAHLSKINVQKGQKVSQSDIIGLVGSTGWSTGPHLHFEFRVNGVHQDPLTIARQSESLPINTVAKAQFGSAAAMVRVALAAAGSIQQASAQ